MNDHIELNYRKVRDDIVRYILTNQTFTEEEICDYVKLSGRNKRYVGEVFAELEELERFKFIKNSQNRTFCVGISNFRKEIFLNNSGSHKNSNLRKFSNLRFEIIEYIRHNMIKGIMKFQSAQIAKELNTSDVTVNEYIDSIIRELTWKKVRCYELKSRKQASFVLSEEITNEEILWAGQSWRICMDRVDREGKPSDKYSKTREQYFIESEMIDNGFVKASLVHMFGNSFSDRMTIESVVECAKKEYGLKRNRHELSLYYLSSNFDKVEVIRKKRLIFSNLEHFKPVTFSQSRNLEMVIRRVKDN